MIAWIKSLFKPVPPDAWAFQCAYCSRYVLENRKPKVAKRYNSISCMWHSHYICLPCVDRMYTEGKEYPNL